MNVEIIKHTENMEFDVIYGDGTRRHVAEGILYEVDGNEIIFHKGTDRMTVILACAEDILKFLCMIDHGLEALVLGMSITADAAQALCRLASYFPESHDPARDQAIFRLGQMDFQQCAADALEAASKTIENGLVSLAFLQVAALVRDMKVSEGCIEE